MTTQFYTGIRIEVPGKLKTKKFILVDFSQFFDTTL